MSSGSHGYTSAKEKYEDNKSSGWTFTVFGIIGFIFTLLNLVKIFNIYSSAFQFVVSGCMFAAFIVVGIVSFKNADHYKSLISKEEEDTAKYKAFLKENVTYRSTIACQDPLAEKEANELVVIENIKESMVTEFPDIDTDLAYALAEEHYDAIRPARDTIGTETSPEMEEEKEN